MDEQHRLASSDPTASPLIDFGYLPFVVLMLVGGLALLYRQALPRPLPWYRHVPGAALAALIFLVAVPGVVSLILGAVAGFWTAHRRRIG